MIIIVDFLFGLQANVTYSIDKIIHKSIMRFELLILNLNIANGSVRLIFTTVKCDIIILPFYATTSVLAPTILRSPKSMNIIIINFIRIYNMI